MTGEVVDTYLTATRFRTRGEYRTPFEGASGRRDRLFALVGGTAFCTGAAAGTLWYRAGFEPLGLDSCSQVSVGE